MADAKLFDQYMDLLNRVVESDEIRSAMEELAISGAGIRMRMVNDAASILRTAPREFAAYRAAIERPGLPQLDEGPFVTRTLRWIALSFGLAGLALLAMGIWLPWGWTSPATWAGCTLLVAAALVMIANRAKDTKFGSKLMAADPVNGRLDVARGLLVGAIEDDLLSEVRVRVNAAREDRFGHTMTVIPSPGLSEVHDRSYHVSTSVVAQLDRLLDHLAGASVGVAGPRGSGKSTLVRRYCEALPNGGQADLRCMVSAPVDYVAKEFVLHLFSTFCRSVINYFGRESAGRRTGRILEITILLQSARQPALDLVAFVLVPALVLYWRTDIAGVVGITATTTGIAAGVLAILGIPRAWFWTVSIVGAVRRNASRKRIPRMAIAHAKRNLDRCRYLQTWSHGWSGTLQLPVAASGQVMGNLSKAEQLLSYPEVVEQFRRFARHIAGVVHKRGDRVCIGVDELDKIGSPEQAERFLNEIKGVFGVPHVYFFVSVSDDALTAFERRGLPLRDTFDSSFDEIIRVGPMPYVESRRLLYRRVIGLTEPYVALCHCMAGGLPRDLIRAARQVIQTGTGPAVSAVENLTKTAATIAAEEIRRKAAATNAALPSGNQDLRRFLYTVAKGDYIQQPALKVLDELPPVIADESEDAIQIRRDFAAYVYFCATLEDVFNDRLDVGRMIIATAENSDKGTFDALASARYAFAQDTYLAWHAITDFRMAWDLEIRPIS